MLALKRKFVVSPLRAMATATPLPAPRALYEFARAKAPVTRQAPARHATKPSEAALLGPGWISSHWRSVSSCT